MKVVLERTVTDVQITEEERKILLKASTILDSIWKTLDQNDGHLNNEMSELFTCLTNLDSIEGIVDEYLSHEK